MKKTTPKDFWFVILHFHRAHRKNEQRRRNTGMHSVGSGAAVERPPAPGLRSASRQESARGREAAAAYQRRPMACCILAGEMEGGGLDMEMPVRGLMMGMALRPRVAAGWWSFMLDWWLWRVGGMKEGEVELREKPGATD